LGGYTVTVPKPGILRDPSAEPPRLIGVFSLALPDYFPIVLFVGEYPVLFIPGSVKSPLFQGITRYRGERGMPSAKNIGVASHLSVFFMAVKEGFQPRTRTIPRNTLGWNESDIS